MNRILIFLMVFFSFGMLNAFAEGPVATGDLPIPIGIGKNFYLLLGKKSLPVVAMDFYHAPSPKVHTYRDLSKKGYSRLFTSFSRHRCVIMPEEEAWSDESLKNIDILIISSLGWKKIPTEREMEALDQFMRRGGKVILTVSEYRDLRLAVFFFLAKRYGVILTREKVSCTPGLPESKKRITNFQDLSGKGLLRGARRLYFEGVVLQTFGKAKPFLTYQGKTIAARVPVGKGELLVFSAPSLISNRYSSYREKNTRYYAEKFPFLLWISSCAGGEKLS